MLSAVILSAIECEEDRLLIEDLYEQHNKLVYNFAQSRLHRSDLAEETVQETFVRLINFGDIIQKVNRRDEHNVTGYIMMVSCNVIRQLAKKHKIISENQAEFDDIHDDDLQPGPEELIINDESLEETIRSIISLDEKYRNVIIMKYAQRLDNAKIAQTLGITEPNVRKRLQRAKIMLRKVLLKKMSEEA